MKWLLIGCIVGLLFGIVLKLPKLVGLGLPVLYSLVIVWIPGWSTAHPVLSNGIFLGLIGFNVLLWLIGLGQAIYDQIIEHRIQQGRYRAEHLCAIGRVMRYGKESDAGKKTAGPGFRETGAFAQETGWVFNGSQGQRGRINNTKIGEA